MSAGKLLLLVVVVGEQTYVCMVVQRRPNVPQRFWGVAGRRKATFPLTAPGAVMWMRGLCSVQQRGHLLLRPWRNGLTTRGKAGCAGRVRGVRAAYFR